MKKTLVVAILIVAMILGIVAYAFAATASVTVTATVLPKFAMTVDTTAIPLGSIDPDSLATLSAAGPQVNVRSNRGYSFSRTWTTNPGNAFSDTYVNDLTAARTGAAGVNYNGNMVFDPNFDLAEGLNTGIIQFTATQN
jgi:hypothetical protein